MRSSCAPVASVGCSSVVATAVLVWKLLVSGAPGSCRIGAHARVAERLWPALRSRGCPGFGRVSLPALIPAAGVEPDFVASLEPHPASISAARIRVASLRIGPERKRRQLLGRMSSRGSGPGAVIWPESRFGRFGGAASDWRRTTARLDWRRSRSLQMGLDQAQEEGDRCQAWSALHEA